MVIGYLGVYKKFVAYRKKCRCINNLLKIRAELTG